MAYYGVKDVCLLKQFNLKYVFMAGNFHSKPQIV